MEHDYEIWWKELEEEILKAFSPDDLVIEVAESQSLWPQAIEGQLMTAEPLSAVQAIAATLVVLKASGRQFWASEKWIRHMAQRCYIQQYEGHWATLQIALESSTEANRFEECIQAEVGIRPYYGMQLKSLSKRFERTLVEQHPNKLKKNRPQRKSRRRGYRDKGSRAPDYIAGRKNIGIPISDSNLTKIDRRSKILHPLCSAGKLSPGRDPPLEHVHRRLEILKKRVQQRKDLIDNARYQEESSEQGCGPQRDPEIEKAEIRGQEESYQESCKQENKTGDRAQGSTAFSKKGSSPEWQSTPRTIAIKRTSRSQRTNITDLESKFTRPRNTISAGVYQYSPNRSLSAPSTRRNSNSGRSSISSEPNLKIDR